MLFHIYYPTHISGLERMNSYEFGTFFQALFKCIKERGHDLKLTSNPIMPFGSPGKIVINVHTIADHINTFHVKRGYLDKQFYIDSRGYSGWSELALSNSLFEETQNVDESAARTFVEDYRKNVIDRNISKLPQPSRHYEPKGRPYLFLPLQVCNDTVIQLSRIDYFQFVTGAAEAVRGSGIDLVIKRHPRCSSKEVFNLLSQLSQQPNIIISNTSIPSLIKHSKAVLCINSGVGFESLFYYKPVITVGASDYEWVTQPVHTLADLRSLPDMAERPVDTRVVAKFLYSVCTNHFVNADDEQSIHRKLERIERTAVR
ncbi:MAG: hypothetical protein WC799_11660 [Desulfobacteraceae bacterium]|jgi:capsule polysaccharide export protein KpsC/LpsZ